MKHIVKKLAALMIAATLTFNLSGLPHAFAEDSSQPAPEETPSSETSSSESSSSDPSSSEASSSDPSSSETSSSDPSSSETSSSDPSSSETSSSDPSSSETSSSESSISSEPSYTEPEESSEEETPVYETVSEEPEATPTPAPKRNSIERPKATIKPDFSANTEVEEKKESNYVTFATLNLKENSMSRNLFMLGAVFIAIGVLGIFILILLHIKRRRLPPSDNNEIFAAIREAEDRSRGAGTMHNEMLEDYPNEQYVSGYPQQEYNNTQNYQAAENYSAYNTSQNAYDYQNEQVNYETEDPYAAFASPVAPYSPDEYDDYSSVDATSNYQAAPPVYPSYSANEPSQSVNNPSPQSYNTEEILREALNYNPHSDNNSY
ncbi:hypothetical protein [Scatolibacter rhodanostii]|uniref:hypothetical protein n=1 Tax=Scatolibacter rhodanostii TaxID=2014781 RepID=UPI00190EB243|nr:hypothetical protein [Scatolibacter rhodanostii]